MSEEQLIRLTREQLYNEIWEISVMGVAKKYNVSYSSLLVNCKEWDIPVPPSGYWTKLSFGKTVAKSLLPESTITEITLSISAAPRHSKRSDKSPDTGSQVEREIRDDKTEKDNQKPEEEISSIIESEQMPYQTVRGQYNNYNRQTLYEEVWAKPVVQVAVQYGVSDVAIHKICKSLQIPVPPRGYWARLRAGEKMPRPLLPDIEGMAEKTGTRTFTGNKSSGEPQQVLLFLDESERVAVFNAAQQIKMPDDNTHVHKKIAAYRSVIKEWNKKDNKPDGAQREFKNYAKRPPFLAGVISEEALPRVLRILNALFRQVESLGGSVNDDLTLKIRNETVHLEISEGQDVIDHVMTREEAQALLIYKDAKRRNSWASEPQIRKHDYIFNGRLRICIREHRYFRDSDKNNVESKLGEMLIELYEQSEVVRKARLAKEEAERKRLEDERLRQDRRVRYNEEVEKTNALLNLAQDYYTACKIRAFVAALEDDNSGDNSAEFIDWAKKKADWFDPNIARTDEILGDREHERGSDYKRLEKRYY